jgi:hypothetical protein
VRQPLAAGAVSLRLLLPAGSSHRRATSLANSEAGWRGARADAKAELGHDVHLGLATRQLRDRCPALGPVAKMK